MPECSVKQVSLGGQHSAAVTFDGSLYLWGYNSLGQLGNGTTSQSNRPIKVMDNIKCVSLGGMHSAAVTADGSLYMWGQNGCGQLGNGTTTNSSRPIKIMDNVKDVALGSNHSAAITTDGSLYLWGDNYSGQLGIGTTAYSNTPIKVMRNVKQVSLGENYSAAITTDDSLYCWGENASGQLGDGTQSNRYSPNIIAHNIDSVSLGSDHTTAVTCDNSFFVWGNGSYGRFGNNHSDSFSSPQWIRDNIVSSSSGNTFSIILTIDGRVFTCGDNRYGQLGFYSPNINQSGSFIEIGVYDRTPKLTAPVGAKANDPVGAGSTKTVTFNGYKPNGIYNFYSMKNKEDGLASDNLLYLSQVTANDNGSVTITYTGTDVCDNPAEFLESLEAVDIGNLTLEATDNTYNGFEQYYQPVIKNGSYELSEGIDYTFEGAYHATDAGEYTVIINGKGVFTGSRTETFTISPFNVSNTSTDGEEEFTYNGSAFTPEIRVNDQYRELVKDTDYTISYQNNKNPGIAIAEITGIGNYTGRKVVHFDIHSCDISKNSTVELVSIPYYSGEPITPDFTLTVNNNVLEKDTDYTVNYYNNINKGIGVIEIKGKGGYEGRIVCWFDITECDIGEFGLCSSVKYQVYSGDEQNPEPTVTVQGRRLVKGVDYTVEYNNNSAVGIATITVKGIGNYSGVLSTSFEIIDEAVGDANLDRNVNINDVTAIQRYLAEIETLDEKNLVLADTNGDDEIDISDATYLQMYLAGYDVVLGK